jgi:glycosyltransferase involved in cell wall biosynthesis
LNLPGASWFEPDIAESAEALMSLYRDPELRKNLAGKGRETYMRFRDSHEMRNFVTDRLAEWARPEPDASTKLIESPPRVDQSPLKTPEIGVNLVGYLESEFGMGEYAWRLLATLQSAKVPTRCEVLQSRAIRSTEVLPPEQARAHGDSLPFPINVVVINADDMRGWADTEGKALIRDRYTIGVWAWELETFPLDLHEAFNYVDEIWAISKFSANSIAEFSPVPVFAVPPLMGDENPITEEQKNQIRKNLKLEPDDFLVTFTFDYYGTLERKNPAGVIRAFMSAFKPDDGAKLILKSTNESTDLPGRAALHDLAAQRPDIRFIEEYWGKAQMRALVAASDVYISLHRSEGLGLGIAEALSSGVEVMTTAYGGHLDFADDSNATLVDYQLQPVGDKAQPYPADAWWAEPNIDNAAKHLRRIFNEARPKPRQMHKPSKLRASLKAEAKDFINERLQTITAELGEYSPQPLILSPIEGTTEPEGDQKNPVWWQVQPSAWYEFLSLGPSLDMSRLSVSIFITNASCKRLATITITLGQSKVQLRMKSANERFMVSLPLKCAKPTDEIRIDVEGAPMRLDGDNRDLYLLVGPTYVSENLSLSSEATYRRINAPSSLTNRVRQSILRLFSG